jgi:hypothetical protein
MTFHVSEYQENEQNRIFLILDETMLIVDSTNYIKKCPHCKMLSRIYVYGAWPDVRVSFDGATDLPICAVVHGIKIFKTTATLFSEPSFGQFIYTYPIDQSYENCTIIYYPIGVIKQNKMENYRYLTIDGIPVVCCQTIDDKCVIINSNGEVLDTEIVHSAKSEYTTFIIGNGILKYIKNNNYWIYTANPALKTKPAERE